MSAKDSILYIGAILDSQLNLKEHIKSKCQKAVYNIHCINNIKRHLSMESKKILMSSLVLSHFDYLNSVFVGLPDSTIKPMQLLQNFAARVTVGKGKYESGK